MHKEEHYIGDRQEHEVNYVSIPRLLLQEFTMVLEGDSWTLSHLEHSKDLNGNPTTTVVLTK